MARSAALRAVRVFLFQLVYVLLLGLQTLNVVDRNYLGAWSVSLLLGMIGFWMTAVIAEVKTDGVGSSVWWAFVLSGPIGICMAMWMV